MQEKEFLKNLVADTGQELEYIQTYQEEVEAAQKGNGRYAELWKKRNPFGQKDNMGMMQRISLEVERGL